MDFFQEASNATGLSVESLKKIEKIILDNGNFSKERVQKGLYTFCCKIGMVRYYFKTTPIETIASHVESILAAEVIALNRGSKQLDVDFVSEQPDSAMYLINDDHEKGIENDSLVQILTPFLNPTDRIITDGAYGLPDPARVEDPAVHGQIDTRRQDLHGGEGESDVEMGVRFPEGRRLHGPGEDDDLLRDTFQTAAGPGHGVCAVGNEDLPGGVGFHLPANESPVVVRDLQAVLPEQGIHFEGDGDVGGVQHPGHLGLHDHEIALPGGVPFVQGPARREDLDVHGASSDRDLFPGTG